MIPPNEIKVKVTKRLNKYVPKNSTGTISKKHFENFGIGKNFIYPKMIPVKLNHMAAEPVFIQNISLCLDQDVAKTNKVP